jgi:predicted metal-binding protein
MQRSLEAEELYQEIHALQFELAAQKQLQVEMIHCLRNCAEAIYEMQDQMDNFIDYLENQDDK